MKISKLYASPVSGSSGIAVNSSIDIDDPIQLNGRTSYRKVFYLRFSLDGFADGVAINSEASQLSARFSSYTVNLSESNASFQSGGWQSEEENTLVKIHLNHPWSLQKISATTSCGVGVHRLDGETLSEEPTVKVNSNSTLGVEFVAQSFALKKQSLFNANEVTQAASTGVGLAVQMDMQQGQVGTKGKAADILVDDAKAPIGKGAAAQSDVSVSSVGPHGIRWLKLRSYPTGPRIMLGEVNQTLEAETQVTSWLMEAGEFTQSVTLSPDNPAQFYQALQTQIDRYIDANKDNLDSVIYIPVAIESDAPATFKFPQLAIHYNLIKRHWNHWDNSLIDSGKQVLNFQGGKLQQETISVELPISATVNKATLRTQFDPLDGYGFTGADLLETDLNQATGVMLQQGMAVAAQIKIAAPRQVNQVAVAALGIGEGAKVNVALVVNESGKAKGIELATGELSVDKSEERNWFFIKLNTVAVLDIGDYWLTLTSAEGSLLWLAREGQGKALTDAHGKSTCLTVPLCVELGYSLSQSELPASADQGFNVSFDNHHFSLTEELDIAGDLGGGKTDITLSSSQKAKLTLYPPEIEYS